MAHLGKGHSILFKGVGSVLYSCWELESRELRSTVCPWSLLQVKKIVCVIYTDLPTHQQYCVAAGMAQWCAG